MSGIDVERSESGVITLWLDNPRRLNALSDAMILGLCDAMSRLADDANCRVIVLRGRGGVFSAGRDLTDVKALQSAGTESAAEDLPRDAADERGDLLLAAPVVSVIEKYAFGIATMLASWSDIALADEGAQFGYPEVQHGITPYGAVPTMRKKEKKERESYFKPVARRALWNPCGPRAAPARQPAPPPTPTRPRAAGRPGAVRPRAPASLRPAVRRGGRQPTSPGRAGPPHPPACRPRPPPQIPEGAR